MVTKVRFMLFCGLIIAAALIIAFATTGNTPAFARTVSSYRTQATGNVERGKYIVTVGSCVDCHGAPQLAKKGEEPPLAGGAEFNLGPLGIYYATNLTALQGWTDADFLKVFHEGIEPKKNRVLAPIMPYFAYHGMADDDVKAVGAYLQSLTPVKNDVPEAKIGAAAADALKPLPAQSVPMPKIDTSVEYGAYLIHHISACGDCHSPHNPDGSPMVDAPELSGGGINLGGEDNPLFATPIRGEILVAQGYSLDTFKLAMRQGIRPWGALIPPIMPYRAFKTYTDDDLLAQWNFLLTLKAVPPWPVPKASAPGGAIVPPTVAPTAEATAAK